MLGMAKLKVCLVVFKRARGSASRNTRPLTYRTLHRDLGNHINRQPRGSFPHFDLCTRSSTGAPIQVLPLCLSSLASYCPSVSRFPPVTMSGKKPSEGKGGKNTTHLVNTSTPLSDFPPTPEKSKMRRKGGGEGVSRSHQAFLSRLGQTRSSRGSEPRSPPLPTKAGAVWAPAVPMVTADYTAPESQGAGGCAHLPVQAGEGRAVPAQSLGAGRNSPSGLRPAFAPGSGEAPRRPRSARSRCPAPPLRLLAGRPSPASADREDVGGPRAPPRPARRMTLEGKLPALQGRGAAAARKAEVEGRTAVSSRRADASAQLGAGGALGVTAGVSWTPAPLRRAFAAAHL